MNENKIVDISKEIISDCNNIIKQLLNNLISLKFFDYDNDTKELFQIENENILYYELLIITNYTNFLSLNIDNAFFQDIENYDISNEINRINIYNYKNNSFNIIASITFNSEKSVGKYNIAEMNRSYQILLQILIFISKFYEENIFNIKEILLFFNIIIIFINENSKNNDKYIKIKNIVFFELLIEKYIGCFSSIIFKNKENKNNEIELFLRYIIKIFNDTKLNTFYNSQFLSNNKIISKFLLNLFNIINNKENIVIFNKYKDELIKTFANIYKNNTNESNFFDKLINQNKKSFINLVNYEKRKENINKDFYTQNFYIDLLNKLFSNENKIK